MRYLKVTVRDYYNREILTIHQKISSRSHDTFDVEIPHALVGCQGNFTIDVEGNYLNSLTRRLLVIMDSAMRIGGLDVRDDENLIFHIFNTVSFL